MFSYIWIFLQVALVTKMVILYFGNRATIKKHSTDDVFLGLAIALTVFSLSYFVCRKARRR